MNKKLTEGNGDGDPLYKTIALRHLTFIYTMMFCKFCKYLSTFNNKYLYTHYNKYTHTHINIENIVILLSPNVSITF